MTAGLHERHHAVLEALTHEVGEGTELLAVEATELIATTNRAVVIVRFAGTKLGETFDYETVFHLRTSDGLVVAVTEYSGDQYSSDAVME